MKLGYLSDFVIHVKLGTLEPFNRFCAGGNIFFGHNGEQVDKVIEVSIAQIDTCRVFCVTSRQGFLYCTVNK